MKDMDAHHRLDASNKTQKHKQIQNTRLSLVGQQKHKQIVQEIKCRHMNFIV